MSKCYPNWQRIPNSRMDRQHRPKQFFRQKWMTENPNRLNDKLWQKMKKEKEAMLHDK